ncbi:hypothetical protein TNCV_2276971 [Trichonephila clavipes]|nr:hypothetical protein TNCV_2276971 [Trichonephila clavipes]
MNNNTVNSVSPSPVATRTRAAVSAYMDAAKHLMCAICKDETTSLPELRTHVLKHMKTGTRGKGLFPDEFRDSSPEEEKAHNSLSAQKSATRSSPNSNAHGERTSSSTALFAPARHWDVGFYPTVTNVNPNKLCVESNSQKDAEKVVKQSPTNHEEIDILQQLLGSQKETLLDATTESVVTGNSQRASPIPPELQVMVEGTQTGPPKIVPFKKEEYSAKLRKNLHRCHHCSLVFYTKSKLDDHLREEEVLQRAIENIPQVSDVQNPGVETKQATQPDRAEKIKYKKQSTDCIPCGLSYWLHAALRRHNETCHGKVDVLPARKKEYSKAIPANARLGKNKREQLTEGPRGHGATSVANAQPTNADALCCEVCGKVNKTHKSLKYHQLQVHGIPLLKAYKLRGDNEPEENPVNNDQQESVPPPPSPDAVPPITSQAFTTAAAAPGAALLGETLRFTFPLPRVVACPIHNCVHTFCIKAWYTTTNSAKKHLRIYHRLFNRTTQYCCSICDKNIPTKPFSHPCLEAAGTMLKEVGQNAWLCEECGESFTTKTGLNNHAKMHKRTEVADRMVPLEIPEGPQTRRASRQGKLKPISEGDPGNML